MAVTTPVTRVDLHTHLLPGVDDGAATLAEAEAMARVAVEEGIGRLALTPHNLQWPPGTGPAALEARATELARRLVARNLPLQVVPGAEMALIPALPRQIDAGEFLTLNGSRYLLVELPHYGLPHQLEETLFEVQVRGLVPILAHPERNSDLQRQLGRLRALVERGLLLQITAGSLEGHFGPAARQAARRLLEANMVHAIASDAHDPRDRAPRLAKAQALAAEIVGPEWAEALVSANPAAILDDQPLEVEPPASPRRRFGWW